MELSYDFGEDRGYTDEDQSQYLDATWATLEETVSPNYGIASQVVSRTMPPANKSHYRDIKVKAVSMDGDIQMNKGCEPLLNPYDFFSLNVSVYDSLRDPQVSTKLCVWCSRKECLFWENSDRIMCTAIDQVDCSRIDATTDELRDDNCHVRRVAYQAYNTAVHGKKGAVSNIPLPFCVEGRIKIMWPSRTYKDL